MQKYVNAKSANMKLQKCDSLNYGSVRRRYRLRQEDLLSSDDRQGLPAAGPAGVSRGWDLPRKAADRNYVVPGLSIPDPGKVSLMTGLSGNITMGRSFLGLCLRLICTASPTAVIHVSHRPRFVACTDNPYVSSGFVSGLLFGTKVNISMEAHPTLIFRL